MNFIPRVSQTSAQIMIVCGILTIALALAYMVLQPVKHTPRVLISPTPQVLNAYPCIPERDIDLVCSSKGSVASVSSSEAISQ